MMEIVSKRPDDSEFNQQKLTGWQPMITIHGLIAIFIIIGLLFVPIGVSLLLESDNLMEYSMTYDSSDGNMDVSCSITESNANGNCSIPYTFTEDITGPLYLYYEISNFYQNHRRYVKSRSANQLMGSDLSYDEVYGDCFPLVENSTMLLNPCGLIANSFFNDVITLTSSSSNVELDTDGISWPADQDVKFNQVDGFVSARVRDPTISCEAALGSDAYSDCSSYTDSDGTMTYYWYPNDDTVQYLHESYPSIVSPLEGVENEHFIVWMRTAGLPKFRKFYGKIDTDVSAGDSMTFNVATNFEVASFAGSKSLVLTTLTEFGGKNPGLGWSYLSIGSISLCIGVLFLVKRLVSPRPLGDIKSLGWKQYQSAME